MKRALAAAVAALPVLSVLALAAPPARAADSADECVRLRQSPREGGLSLDVDNHCDRRLACSVAWTVACQTERGRTTRTSKERARFVVAASESAHAFASTKTCGDNWSVDDVTWECAPVR